MARGRLKFVNFYSTLLSSPITLTKATSGTTTIPVASIPWVYNNSQFYLLFAPWTNDKQVIKCFMDNWVVKVNNWDIITDKTYPANTMVNMNDVAEIVNNISNETDDFWKVESTGWLDIVIYWGRVDMDWTVYTVSNTTITLATGIEHFYIYFDYTTNAFAVANISQYPNTVIIGYIIAHISTIWWVAVVEDWRSKQMNYMNLSEDYFEKLDWQYIIKDDVLSNLSSAQDAPAGSTKAYIGSCVVVDNTMNGWLKYEYCPTTISVYDVNWNILSQDDSVSGSYDAGTGDMTYSDWTIINSVTGKLLQKWWNLSYSNKINLFSKNNTFQEWSETVFWGTTVFLFKVINASAWSATLDWSSAMTFILNVSWAWPTSITLDKFRSWIYLIYINNASANTITFNNVTNSGTITGINKIGTTVLSWYATNWIHIFTALVAWTKVHLSYVWMSTT